MKFSSSPTYRGLRRSEDGTASPQPRLGVQTTIFLSLGWVFVGIFALSTGLQAVVHARSHSDHHPAHASGTFATGFSTEFDIFKPYMQEEPKMFYGGPRWNSNNIGYAIHNPKEPNYVGPPTDEIDTAWQELLRGRYLNVTEEEAEMAFGRPHGLYNHPGLGFLIGLDVYHALHCVDELRRALDREHYYNKQTKHGFPERAHRDHCLDHLRQQLMCHADLTPIPVIWYEAHGRSFVQSDVVHTCRNWDRIQEFKNSRVDMIWD
ncbi:hypothetical protein DL95DRAFT_468325 [Leptodontidium sp. 2 PMI_412]|nr:hypothetical protein BKA61DRAFT_498806 [Leptodontidium sp. MPI-SDFR-AT-0119]KAH9207805.1 hypothetical protein DL95DRAFT_468325 [Leptodontidium sp. 2 PMI_412]